MNRRQNISQIKPLAILCAVLIAALILSLTGCSFLPLIQPTPTPKATLARPSATPTPESVSSDDFRQYNQYIRYLYHRTSQLLYTMDKKLERTLEETLLSREAASRDTEAYYRGRMDAQRSKYLDLLSSVGITDSLPDYDAYLAQSDAGTLESFEPVSSNDFQQYNLYVKYIYSKTSDLLGTANKSLKKSLDESLFVRGTDFRDTEAYYREAMEAKRLNYMDLLSQAGVSGSLPTYDVYASQSETGTLDQDTPNSGGQSGGSGSNSAPGNSEAPPNQSGTVQTPPAVPDVPVFTLPPDMPCEFGTDGKRSCTTCNGTGKLDVLDGTIWGSGCKTCNGTGRMICIYCGGTGYR